MHQVLSNSFNVNARYTSILWLVQNDGQLVESRIGPTKEMPDMRFICAMGDIPRRAGMNLSIGWTEMLQLIGGVYTREVFERVAPNSDLSLFTHNMAYGPRLKDQMNLLLDELRRFPNSRRATLYVGRDVDYIDNLPCTNTIQFLIRDNRLHMLVSMRSWDLVKGLPYDIMMFGGLGFAVCRCLKGVQPGLISVHAGSAHIYQSDTTKLPMKPFKPWSFVFDESVPTEWWSNVTAWARLANDQLQPNLPPVGVSLIKEGQS